MARSDVHPVHRFENWQVWPGSFDNPVADGTYAFPENPGLDITRKTPIASMGSCFAREIRRKLLYFNFNYITEAQIYYLHVILDCPPDPPHH